MPVSKPSVPEIVALEGSCVRAAYNRACVGRLCFKVPGGITYGLHYLNVKFEKSVLRVPFRILTEEEVEDAFIPLRYSAVVGSITATTRATEFAGNPPSARARGRFPRLARLRGFDVSAVLGPATRQRP